MKGGKVQTLTGAATSGIDTDGDGLFDDEEIAIGTNPNNPDTDEDGVPDGLDPAPLNPAIPNNNQLLVDDDTDGLIHCEEIAYKTKKNEIDTDLDGLGDGFEVDLGLDPLDTDSDNDNILDGKEDFDVDGLDNKIEQDVKLNPKDPDYDDDWLLDGEEDTNYNGKQDTSETNPKDADSDRDGVLDGRDTNPLDSLKYTIKTNARECTAGNVVNVNMGSLVCDHRLNQGGGHKVCAVVNFGGGP